MMAPTTRIYYNGEHYRFCLLKIINSTEVAEMQPRLPAKCDGFEKNSRFTNAEFRVTVIQVGFGNVSEKNSLIETHAM
jgi:hypothetical protein